jgi:hypothetical protein
VLDLAPGQSVWPVIDFTMKPRDGFMHESDVMSVPLLMFCSGHTIFRSPSAQTEQSSATNIGQDKDSEKRQRLAIERYAKHNGAM